MNQTRNPDGSPGELGPPRRRPLLWTVDRGPWTVARVERWQETGQVPGRVMVWGREHCGTFLDSIEDERLYALFHLAAYYGLRRSELAGLCWPDVDLATRRVHVRQAQVDEDPGLHQVRGLRPDHPHRPGHRRRLRVWRKAQLAERLAWGAAWTDSGRVFTREDGTPLRPEWISTR